MPSSQLILCRPLLLLPPIPPSIRVFSNESTLRMRWPKYWSSNFSIILSKEIPGLISFRMDWLDLLAVQGTLRNLLQHHSSKASILWHSAFFTVQLSHPYMTTGKTIALNRRQSNVSFFQYAISNKTWVQWPLISWVAQRKLLNSVKSPCFPLTSETSQWAITYLCLLSPNYTVFQFLANISFQLQGITHSLPSFKNRPLSFAGLGYRAL